jgi:hypothetical protein
MKSSLIALWASLTKEDKNEQMDEMLYRFSVFICNAFICICHQSIRAFCSDADVLPVHTCIVFGFSGSRVLVLENQCQNRAAY